MPLRSLWAADPVPLPQPVVPAPQMLNMLRFVAMRCRAKRRTGLFEACALLHVTRSASLEAHAEALVRCLSEVLGTTPRLHAPGISETSFDEAWLVQLGQAIDRQDKNSVAFLMRSRIAPEHRRLVLYLMQRITEYFSQD